MTLSNYVGIFLHSFDFHDNRYVEFENWKVAMELLFRVSWVEGIARKKKWQTFIFFIWLISQNSVRFTYATTLFQVWEYVKIGFRVLAFLTYRDRVPFCPGFVSLIYLLWMFHDKKLTPL